jgi:hypothetical protein
MYELIEQHGHKVLHIPAYDCQLNPTELVWSQTDITVAALPQMGLEGRCGTEGGELLEQV